MFNVVDGGPALNQHWVNVSRFLCMKVLKIIFITIMARCFYFQSATINIFPWQSKTSVLDNILFGLFRSIDLIDNNNR